MTLLRPGAAICPTKRRPATRRRALHRRRRCCQAAFPISGARPSPFVVTSSCGLTPDERNRSVVQPGTLVVNNIGMFTKVNQPESPDTRTLRTCTLGLPGAGYGGSRSHEDARPLALATGGLGGESDPQSLA